MAEILPPPPDQSYESTSNPLADQWIIGFKKDTSKAEQEEHIAKVEELCKQNDSRTDRQYKGVMNVFDALAMYAGEFHPDVVQWIREQPAIENVEPNQQTRALGLKKKK